MRNVRDPKGMMCDELAADMHVVSGDATAVRNLMLAVERCHLAVEGVVATPYAAGLAALVDDEVELGTTVVDMGGGTTSFAVFAGGSLVHVDAVAVGGNHVTMDIARGFNTRLADAERLKTLYGACIASVSDERETVVTLAGDDGDHPTHVPKSQLVRNNPASRRRNFGTCSRSAEGLGLCGQLLVGESSSLAVRVKMTGMAELPPSASCRGRFDSAVPWELKA